MRLALSLALAVLVAIPAGAAVRRTTLPPPPHLPQATEIVETEYAIDLGRPRLGQGRVRLTVRNRGEDDHDLTLLTGTRVLHTVFVAPGDTATFGLRLAPGRYRLICTIADHRALGMETILRIG